MPRKDEWKKAYYNPEKVKKIFVISAIVIVAFAVLINYLFVSIDQGQPVKLDVSITSNDITYSYEDLESADMLKFYITLSNMDNYLSRIIEENTGYRWHDMISNSRDGLKCRNAAILYLYVQPTYTFYDHAYADSLFNLTGQEILSLPIEKIDENDISKENFLLMISYLKAAEELYKAKGIPFAETNIYRLNFLYSYFDAVDNIPEEIAVKGLSETGRIQAKDILKDYNQFYASIGKRIEIIEAENRTIIVKNTGREVIKKDDIYVYSETSNIGDCQWSTENINPGEMQICTLEYSCTGLNIGISFTSKQTVCS
ncbi:MAG: hypothetical protein NT129_03010 [Candidatus Aenigmarchaeota archaeon]|nr:hypothetical protein [Candidatus Aenigmarchaeota archaeon]